MYAERGLAKRAHSVFTLQPANRSGETKRRKKEACQARKENTKTILSQTFLMLSSPAYVPKRKHIVPALLKALRNGMLLCRNYLVCLFRWKAASILSFTHNTYIVIDGARITFYWKVAHAYGVRIKDVGMFPEGSTCTVRMIPGKTRYELIAYGIKGKKRHTVTVSPIAINRNIRFHYAPISFTAHIPGISVPHIKPDTVRILLPRVIPAFPKYRINLPITSCEELISINQSNLNT